jgi:threonine/homoserine/homoserine lactone efflux protein
MGHNRSGLTAVGISISRAGARALLAAPALAFLILKWAGALYLIGLSRPGHRAQCKGLATDGLSVAPITPRAAFLSNLALGLVHLKTIVFFAAFAP